MHILNMAISLYLLLFTGIAKAQMDNKGDWQLVWNDEFEVNGLPDTSKWAYETGDGCPQLCGWGNNESQYYTESRLENARVEAGILIIEAHREKWGSSDYTSAKLNSKPGGTWKYGKIEVKARLQGGRGVWAAIWMMPTQKLYGSWPRCGEIDIMEYVGYLQDSVFGTVHTEAYNHLIGTQKGGQLFEDNLNQHFHVYSIEWDANKMDFFMDNKLFFSFPKSGNKIEEWPFDQNFHIIMNLAVGGNWGAKHGIDPEIWPRKLEVDYVRVYQQNK